MVHAILSDSGKRAEYDRTGSIDSVSEDFNEEAFEQWAEHWRRLFPPITEAQIAEFEVNFAARTRASGDGLRWRCALERGSGGDSSATLHACVCTRACLHTSLSTRLETRISTGAELRGHAVRGAILF